ncbi:hypothetical protein K525DRAFT_275362 [Schizophyllum commune Loenen D]|nr:hypothetical protein K525DRAFT_275362 [Schizophyllum commune Loenen D]
MPQPAAGSGYRNDVAHPHDQRMHSAALSTYPLPPSPPPSSSAAHPPPPPPSPPPSPPERAALAVPLTWSPWRPRQPPRDVAQRRAWLSGAAHARRS